MDITAAIDIAVGLVLMYLILSLFCTTINEFISGIFRLRANTLAFALEELIDHAPLKQAFDLHGLIDTSKVAASGGSKPPAGRMMAENITAGLTGAKQTTPPGPLAQWWNNMNPSYLPSRDVALALIGSLDPGKPIPGIADIQQAVTALPPSNIRSVLLASLTEAGTDIEKLRNSIAAWFDGSMDRLSGAYKRNLQIISFCVGLVIACAFNADTLKIGNQLWHDRSLAQTIAQTAPTFAQKACTSQDCLAKEADSSTPTSAVTNLKALENQLRAFPLGWSVAPWEDPNENFLIKILGLALTAIALVMGAPFWFDLLQKFMNFRATGAEPAKAKQP